MLAAYLRGFLKPKTTYGLRSSLAEDAVIEAMVYQMHIENYETSIKVDSSILGCLTHDGKKETLRSIAMRSARCSELRSMDIYRLRKASRPPDKKNGPSLYQLYHIAKKCGILDALSDTEASATDPPP